MGKRNYIEEQEAVDNMSETLTEYLNRHGVKVDSSNVYKALDLLTSYGASLVGAEHGIKALFFGKHIPE